MSGPYTNIAIGGISPELIRERDSQISQIRTHFPNTRVISINVYEVPINVRGIQLYIQIQLPNNFPRAAPLMVVMSNVTHSLVDDKMIVRHHYFHSWSPRSNLLQALQIIMQLFNERPPEPINSSSSALASIPKQDFTPALNEILRNSSSISEPQLENLVRSNDLIRRMAQQIRDLERECEEAEAQKMLVDMEIKDLNTKNSKILSEKAQLEETQQKNQEILKSLQKTPEYYRKQIEKEIASHEETSRNYERSIRDSFSESIIDQYVDEMRQVHFLRNIQSNIKVQHSAP